MPRKQHAIKQTLPGFGRVTDACLEYLLLGGRLKFEVLTAALIRKFLKRGIPIMTGLRATCLYNTARKYDVDGRVVYDDVDGESIGHFFIPAGYRRGTCGVLVADPFLPNPLAAGSTFPSISTVWCVPSCWVS